MSKKKPFVECDDDLLIRRTITGEKEAYSELVKRYQGKAYSVAFGILGNRDDALEVVQDSFVKAFTSLKDFRFGSKFYTWFYRLLVNRSIDKMRAVSKKPVTSFDETWMKEDEMASPGFTSSFDRPEERVLRSEMKDVIKAAIESLPEHHRVVIILREVEELSYEEIANVLGLSIGTVMSRIHYGREKLRSMLVEYVRDR